ncbi:MAG: hypothetical protein H7281_06200 [Bacteriovorax sp.]|nr:hypothetical protein [Bacteriovorax sp.]
MTTNLPTRFQFKIFVNLIRAMFPNWNFFDRIAYGFELEFKVKNSYKWERISFDQKRLPLGLFISPNCSMALAQVNILEHFARDIQELQAIKTEIHSKDLEDLTTFKMLRSILRVKLNESGFEDKVIQFKIVACDQVEKIDVYISDWIILGPI